MDYKPKMFKKAPPHPRQSRRRVYCKKCANAGNHEAKESPNLTVMHTHIDGFGVLRSDVMCGWCNNYWTTNGDVSDLPGFRDAENTRRMGK